VLLGDTRADNKHKQLLKVFAESVRMVDAASLQQYVSGSDQAAAAGAQRVQAGRIIASLSEPKLLQLQNLAADVVEEAGADRWA
jgi:hypothetical protein